MTADREPEHPLPSTTSNPEESLQALSSIRQSIVTEVSKVVVGQEATVEAFLVALLARGHVLLEGVPGTAKTLLVRAMAKTVDLAFGRIQFTPDLMPSDILGTHVFDLERSEFRLTKGPIFTDVLLADEINRAPAKTQSALLEAMQERQVSIDGKRSSLGAHFTVFATQNPVEQEGTYPLPEAQLDRFLLKVNVGYPTEADEDAILQRAGTEVGTVDLERMELHRVLDAAAFERARAAGDAVTCEDDVRGYVRGLVRATRSSPMLLLGAGPRAGVHLLVASRWRAALEGRRFVTPDDVSEMLHPVLGHRLVLAPEVELDGMTSAEVLDRIAATIEVPR